MRGNSSIGVLQHAPAPRECLCKSRVFINPCLLAILWRILAGALAEAPHHKLARAAAQLAQTLQPRPRRIPQPRLCLPYDTGHLSWGLCEAVHASSSRKQLSQKLQ